MKSYSYIHYTKHFHIMPVWCQLLVWEVCMWGTWIRQDQGHSYNFEGEEACSYPCAKHTGKFSNYLSTYSTPVHNSLEVHTRLYTIETSTVALLKMLQQYTGALTGPKLVARLGVHSWLILFVHCLLSPHVQYLRQVYINAIYAWDHLFDCLLFLWKLINHLLIPLYRRNYLIHVLFASWGTCFIDITECGIH